MSTYSMSSQNNLSWKHLKYENSKANDAIQLFNGVEERVIPEISHTKSKDVEVGQALFISNNPDSLLSDNFK